MSYRLVIKPLAEKDIEESYVWYSKKKSDLGDDFLHQLERSLELVKTHPHQYQVRYKEIRMVRINRVPICMHYTIEKETIFVHAILSTSRNPQIWKNR